MLRLLGWDCGVSTLAWVYIEINLDALAEMDRLAPSLPDSLMRMAELSRRLVCVRSVGIKSLTQGRKVADTTLIERTRELRAFLESDFQCSGDIHVMIEAQSQKIRNATISAAVPAVSHQLMYHFANVNCVAVSPRYKTKVALRPDLTLDEVRTRMQSEKQTVIPAYAIRKQHAIENFICFMKQFDPSRTLKKTHLDDIADAFMSIMGYFELLRSTAKL